MCLPRSSFPLGRKDHQLGEIGGERWAHTRLIIDVVPGMGGMFSLDNGTGRRFLTRSEVCDSDTVAR